jgi:sulfite reductase (NADPH) flavoprotein alpha-component
VDFIASIGVERLCLAAGIATAQLAFTIWCLRKRHEPAIERADKDAPVSQTLIAYASQTGFAQQIAAQTASSLQGATPTRLISLSDLSTSTLQDCEQALFVVSTTGEGDAPDSAARFVQRALATDLKLPRLRYGVLALGDREYDNFCAFGHRLDSWLRRQGAVPLFDVVEVDNGDEGALRHWQHQLSVISGKPDLPDWEAARYEAWQLTERKIMNPGSAGEACYHLVLTPPSGATMQWQAGDIAEIDPRNSSWMNSERLPHREYSIASIPEDGSIHLLVRQMRREDGALGLGSGWLTVEAKLGQSIALRIRTNDNFHLPDDDRPLILIGNGTGIAGLRALIKARIASGLRRHWLIFGERSAAKDRFYGEEIQRWVREGWISDLDLVFSRDQPAKRYVQHRLLERASDIRDWVDSGAAIYVCGSLQGMAPGVHAALIEILGAELLESLSADGRYRRDVY